MSSKPEPAIWSRDIGQRISWYDSCQFNIICMSNIKDICCNPRLHDLVLAGWPPCCATSFVVVVVGRTRPWSMPLAILTIRKELHGFPFLCIRVVPFSIIMGLRLADLRAAGAPLKYSRWRLKNPRTLPMSGISFYIVHMTSWFIETISYCKNLMLIK